ncbi:hypothetical protein [Cohnella rhizosphaerae]|uniref:Uncharacterized protein n=1 Tax=Cohnella rhizosphaerae TaxID=1457232 RepID=A0A9X4KZ76_9BACL|nr:hypothetical protein [Cohnella rhizosphaerae]MDG0813960.1 hypothetical protein [Cohnella rhizosphaerae]
MLNGKEIVSVKLECADFCKKSGKTTVCEKDFYERKWRRAERIPQGDR